MIAWLQQRPLLKFVLVVFALLPASFLVWYYLGGFLAAPAIMIAKPILLGWLSASVDSVALQGTDMMVVTSYGEAGGQIMSASAAGNQLAFPINTRTLSYSIPFYAALHFATPMRGGWGRLGWNLLFLWLLLALGLISITLKDMMLSVGMMFMNTEAVPPADVIALFYQLSVLMIPPLGPVALWAYTARDSPTFLALLPASLRPAQESESSG